MALHNIVQTTTIWGVTNQVIPGNAGPGGSYLTVAPELADRIKKVNTCFVTNMSATTDYEATVYHYVADNNGSGTATTLHLASSVVVPAKSTIVVISNANPVYLNEGDYLGGYSSVVSTLTFTMSYEVIF
tara:strand:+ start:127 stop:516 length:390 start_codon:yes stop_codon:yes gene_type:complete